MKHPLFTTSRRHFLAALLAFAGLNLPSVLAQTQGGAERFEKDILAFEAGDKTNPPPKQATLFVGASNIRRWTGLTNDFRGQKVFNRGFGGALMRDVLHYADRIVLPYEPKAIVLQAGGNDLNAGRSPEAVLADFQALAAKVHGRLPETSITVLAIPPSEARWAQVDKIRAANGLLSQFAQTDRRLKFIDLFPYMTGPDGRPRAELFVADQLHVNTAGYELWTSLLKWQGEIRALLKADKTNAPPAGANLFIGSSSIRKWTTLAQDFPGHKVINHGFGGSHVFDSVVFADELVLPLKPGMIFLYAGGNDINAGKSPERVLADFQAFVKKVHATLPQTRIAYISIAGNPARWGEVEQVRAANRLVEAFTKADPRLTFINVFPAMLAADGQPLPDIFVADKLHMNARGYAIWAKIVEPYLR